MPSIAALRALVTATVGLGVADLVVLNVVIAPAAFTGGPRTASTSPPVRTAPAGAPAPASAPRDREPPEPLEPRVPPLEPRSERASPPPDEKREERVLLDNRLYFATMSATVDATSLATLQQTVAHFGATNTFALEGHADIRGEESFNLALSKQRADAVATELENLGVARANIHVDFVGSTNASPTGQLWRDRRVEIRVTRGPR